MSLLFLALTVVAFETRVTNCVGFWDEDVERSAVINREIGFPLGVRQTNPAVDGCAYRVALVRAEGLGGLRRWLPAERGPGSPPSEGVDA